MKRLTLYIATFAILAIPAFAQESSAHKAGEKTEGAAEKAGEATKGAFKKAGKATDKGLEAAGKGTGTAVEKTGEGVKKAATATGHALKNSGEAVADFFDGDDSANADRVRDVQRQLQAKGYYSGEIDGVAGPKTRSAVSEFQSHENMKVTGKVDKETAKRLGVD